MVEHLKSLDPWATSSLLQKTIRRGNSNLAKLAALKLYSQRGSAVWSRLATIALEDVGIADPAAVIETCYLATDRNLRSAIASETDLISLQTIRLANAPKDRSADYLFTIAKRLARAGVNGEFGQAGRRKRAASPRGNLYDRAAAMLGDGNTDSIRRLWTKGDLEALFGQPDEGFSSQIRNAVLAATRKIDHPFILTLPLLWDEFSAHSPCNSIENQEPPSLQIAQGIPLYTFDKHTRVGKRAIAQFADQNAELRGLLERYSQESRLEPALLAAFYVDAAFTQTKLQWARTNELEQGGRRSDFEAVGYHPDAVEELVECVERHLPELNNLRLQAWLGVHYG